MAGSRLRWYRIGFFRTSATYSSGRRTNWCRATQPRAVVRKRPRRLSSWAGALDSRPSRSIQKNMPRGSSLKRHTRKREERKKECLSTIEEEMYISPAAENKNANAADSLDEVFHDTHDDSIELFNDLV